MSDTPNSPPTEVPSKPLVQTKSAGGVAVMLLGYLAPTILDKLGIHEAGEQAAIIQGLGVLIGAALTLWGRYAATHKVSGIFK